MEPFKNLINVNLFETLAARIEGIYPDFKSQQFCKAAAARLDELELKQRVSLAVDLCHEYLPDSYREAVNILKKVVVLKEDSKESLFCIFMPEYVSCYGIDDFDFSLDALELFTRYSTSEMGIRPFIMHDSERAMERMCNWSLSENEHVRRLSSEGSRPRLPWSPQLKMFMKDPEPVRQILENLKADDSLYVRKSVANHLNDITKDNPEWMLDLVESWDMKIPETAWIVKRAARSLLKAGHPRAFKLFGFTADPKLKVGSLLLNKESLTLGDYLEFSFDIDSESDEPQMLSIDYKVHYVKKNGKLSPKVFKLKEMELQPSTAKEVKKKQQFIDFSTRKHYPGRHRIEIMINGQARCEAEFELRCH